MKEIFENWRKSIEEDVDTSSFVVRDELHQDFWNRPGAREGVDRLDSEIREKLLKIARHFMEKHEVSDVTIKDITFTGSLANYNWSKYSDVDLHIIIDFAEVDENTLLVKEYFNSRKSLWNLQHEIMIRDFEVEIYVQDEKELHASTGVYSILNDEWVVRPAIPIESNPNEIDFDNVKKKAESLMDQIDRALELYERERYQEAIDRAEMLRDKIRKFRRSGLEAGGEYSVENIAFKALRRNEYLLKLSQLKHDAYDKLMSIEEGVVVKFPGQDPLKPRKSYDPISQLSNKELLALAAKEFPSKGRGGPPKITAGSPEEEEFEKLMAPRTPVRPEEEQYSEQHRAKMIVWTYENGGQDEIPLEDYLDAKLLLKRSAKHAHLQTHIGGEEV
jgi:predicted nucleotidyltransferase